jgi:RecA-family ATPase
MSFSRKVNGVSSDEHPDDYRGPFYDPDAEEMPEFDENGNEVKKRQLPKIRSIFEYADSPPDPKDNLLGNRFLCRQGSMLFVAQSGIGKSSASVQQDILWSLGKPAFGIKPSCPLRILTIQAEDDEGDMHEFTNSVKNGMELTKEEVIIANQNCKYVGHKELTGLMFLNEIVAPLLELTKPDLLRINPLQAYLGADIGDPFETGKFLRNTLNPLLEKYNCGCIIVHHTPKTTYQNKEEWKTSDWMYACTGSADITNWGRSILVVTATNENDKVFAWIAAKRTNRIGWCDDDGVNTGIQYYKHGDNGSMLWLPCEEIDKPQQTKKKNTGQFEEKYNQQQILDAMDFIEPKRARALQIYVCENTGMSKSQFYDMWNPLKASGKIIEEEGKGWKKLV